MRDAWAGRAGQPGAARCGRLPGWARGAWRADPVFFLGGRGGPSAAGAAATFPALTCRGASPPDGCGVRGRPPSRPARRCRPAAPSPADPGCGGRGRAGWPRGCCWRSVTVSPGRWRGAGGRAGRGVAALPRGVPAPRHAQPQGEGARTRSGDVESRRAACVMHLPEQPRHFCGRFGFGDAQSGRGGWSADREAAPRPASDRCRAGQRVPSARPGGSVGGSEMLIFQPNFLFQEAALPVSIIHRKTKRLLLGRAGFLLPVCFPLAICCTVVGSKQCKLRLVLSFPFRDLRRREARISRTSSRSDRSVDGTRGLTRSKWGK